MANPNNALKNARRAWELIEEKDFHSEGGKAEQYADELKAKHPENRVTCKSRRIGPRNENWRYWTVRMYNTKTTTRK